MFNRELELYEKIILGFAAFIILILILAALPEKKKEVKIKDPFLRAAYDVVTTVKNVENHSAWFPLVYSAENGILYTTYGNSLYNLNQPIESSKYHSEKYEGYKKLCNIIKSELSTKDIRECSNRVFEAKPEVISDFGSYFEKAYSFETKDGAQWLVEIDTYELPLKKGGNGKYKANIFVDVNGGNTHILGEDTLYFTVTADGKALPADELTKKYYSDLKIENKPEIKEIDINVPLEEFRKN